MSNAQGGAGAPLASAPAGSAPSPAGSGRRRRTATKAGDAERHHRGEQARPQERRVHHRLAVRVVLRQLGVGLAAADLLGVLGDHVGLGVRRERPLHVLAREAVGVVGDGDLLVGQGARDDGLRRDAGDQEDGAEDGDDDADDPDMPCRCAWPAWRRSDSDLSSWPPAEHRTSRRRGTHPDRVRRAPYGLAMRSSDLDPTTPVLVGVGQCAERIDDPGYEGLSAADLAGRAAAHALADTGADPAARRRRDRHRRRRPPVRDVHADRRGAARPGRQLPARRRRPDRRRPGARDPRRRRRPGAAAAGDRARGRDRRRRAGGRAGRRLGGDLDHPPPRRPRRPARLHRDRSAAQLEDRGIGLRGLVSWHTAIHGLLRRPGPVRPVRERPPRPARPRPRGVRRGHGRAVRAVHRVAAAQPARRGADGAYGGGARHPERAQPPDRRPLPALPGRARPGQPGRRRAADVGRARPAGSAYPRSGGSSCTVTPTCAPGTCSTARTSAATRPPASPYGTRSRSPAPTLDDVTVLDLYSCFPVAVSSVLDGLDLAADDPRGLTLTGGLPFFGGAGNNYSMHAIAEAVAALPDRPGRARPRRGQRRHARRSTPSASTPPSRRRGARTAARSCRPRSRRGRPRRSPSTPRAGRRIETYTVRYGRDGRRPGIVIGRLDDRARASWPTPSRTTPRCSTCSPGRSRSAAGLRACASTTATGSRPASSGWMRCDPETPSRTGPTTTGGPPSSRRSSESRRRRSGTGRAWQPTHEPSTRLPRPSGTCSPTAGSTRSGWSVPPGCARSTTTGPEVGARLHHSVGSWPLLLDDETEVVAVGPRLLADPARQGPPDGHRRGRPSASSRSAAETRVVIEEDAHSGPAKLVPKVLRDVPLTWRNVESLRRLAYVAERRSEPASKLADTRSVRPGSP